MYDELGDLITRKVGSHRELVRQDKSGQLARSTIGAILRYKRSLSYDVLIQVLTVCGVSGKEREAWIDAWERYGRPRRELMDDLRRSIVGTAPVRPDSSGLPLDHRLCTLPTFRADFLRPFYAARSGKLSERDAGKGTGGLRPGCGPIAGTSRARSQ